MLHLVVSVHPSPAVEKDQMDLVRTAAVRVVEGLGEPFGQVCFRTLVEEFQLDHNPLHRVVVALLFVDGPFKTDVSASPAQAGFTVDSLAAVDDVLKEGLEQEVRARLLVFEPLQPGICAFAEELLEGGE